MGGHDRDPRAVSRPGAEGMRGLRAVFVRLGNLLGRSRQERELTEELEEHLRMHTEDNVRAGMTPEAARREAILKLGGVEATKERYRDRRNVPILETLLRDLRQAGRSLRKNPGFAAVTVLTLALGIGANTAIFTIVNAVMIEPLPFHEPERIVVVWEENARNPGEANTISPANFLRWQERATEFEQMSAFYEVRANLTGRTRPEELVVQSVTSNFFSTLGATPIVGRTFTPEEGPEGQNRVVILGYRLWRDRFGGDSGIVGQTIQLNSNPFTVVGVMPPDFGLFLKAGSLVGKPAQVWVPFAFTAEMREPKGRYMTAIARLKPGVSLARAQAQMATIAAGLTREFPQFNTQWGVRVVPVHDEVSGEMRPTLLVLGGAVAFVLLIVCANVANLLLARGTTRRREIATRTALGASRSRIVMQLLTESLALALAGGALGLLVARWGVGLLIAMSPADVTGLAHVSLDWPVLAFAAVVSILTATLCGLAPALEGSRTDLQESLREGARQAGAGVRMRRLRKALVVSEVALAVVLLVGAGLMLRSFANLHRVNPGFDSRGILTMRVLLPRAKYPDDSKRMQFFEEATARVGALPGVRAAGAISTLPFTGLGSATVFTIAGEPAPAPGQEPVTDVRICDNGYFRAMRVPLLRGRFFTSRELREKSDVVIINEALARQHFAAKIPIGQRITIEMADENVPSEIIGVVGDVKHVELTSEVRPMVYWPAPQLVLSAMALIVRTDLEPLALAPAVERTIQSIDKDQPVSDVRTMEQWVSASLSRTRFSSVLLALFAALALGLAAIGIYGVMSYAVGQRTTEIGIRAALGADARDIRRMILGDGFRLILVGLAIGAPLALILSGTLKTLLYETRGADPVTFAVVLVLLGAGALLASYLPARRAAHVTPMEALRHE